MRTTPTLAFAAAVALLGLTGTAANAQMADKMGPATTTSGSHMDAMSGKMDEKSTTSTKTSTVMRHGHMATAHSKRHCKTMMRHGKKVRSCKTMTHVRHMG